MSAPARSLTLVTLPDRFAVAQLAETADAPEWAWGGPLTAVVRTEEELSIVCREADVPEGVRAQRSWRCLKVQGPLDFSEIGILADLAGRLAEAEVSIFAVSTYNTDYLLLPASDLKRAVEALTAAGHQVFAGAAPRLDPD